MPDCTAAPIPHQRVARACVCCGGTALRRSPAVLMPFLSHRIFGWAPVEITADWGLATIGQGTAYTICSSLQCADCGLLFLDMRFDDSEMAALYSGYREEAYTALRDHYEPGYRARNSGLNEGVPHLGQIEDFLRPHLPAGPALSVLDWGGDTGQNTPFKEVAQPFHIYDISNKEVLPQARVVDKDTAMAGSYDLIVSSNVLEHLPYPLDTVMEMKRAMTAQTVLFIDVPCELLVRSHPAGTELQDKKRHWHEHINFFSAEVLRALAARCGLRVLALEQIATFEGASASLLMACKLA